ncbi:MAG: TIGR00725 family protein [Methanomethylovorans sp.]|uniref:TIGR00725 family protein n=1 Tax=Methanomethylovorans sp. TaxID=2758717 RepID=UPI00353072B4
MVKMQVGVIGGGVCDNKTEMIAEEIGRELALRGVTLICGGLGGVMEASARGAKRQGGTTIGILPGNSREDANRYIDFQIVTNMGHARNAIIAASSDVLIAVGGEYGTLSEIAIALKMGKTVVVIESKWGIEGTIKATDPQEAVDFALNAIP